MDICMRAIHYRRRIYSRAFAATRNQTTLGLLIHTRVFLLTGSLIANDWVTKSKRFRLAAHSSSPPAPFRGVTELGT